MQACEHYEALVSALIDGVLPEAEYAELTAHAASCPRCRQYWQDQLAIHEGITSLRADPPEDLHRRIMEGVARTPQPRPKTKAIPWRRWAAVAACCGVAVLGVLAFGGQERSVSDSMVAYQRTAGGNEAVSAARAAPEGGAAAASQPDEAAVYGAAGDTGGETAPQPVQAPLAEPALETAREEEAQSSAKSQDASQEALQDAGAPESGSPDAKQDAMAESGQPIENFALRLTTASGAAAGWVEETLGQSWVRGGVYALTARQYDQLKALLEDSAAGFTEDAGSGSLYLLQAE